MAVPLPCCGYSDSGMQALSKRVDIIRAKMQRDLDEISDRRADIHHKRALAETLRHRRSGIRKAALITRECDREERSIYDIESGRAKRRFEERVIPFLQAQGELVASARSIGAPSSRGGRQLPGTRKRRRIGEVASWTQQSGTDATIVREFMAEFENMPADPHVWNGDVCAICGGVQLLVERKATLCCEDCGSSVPHIDMSSCAHSTRSEMEFVAQSYKRSNHFLEWLNQLQAKESTRVSDAILERVMGHLYSHGARKAEDITPGRVRDTLKLLKLRAQYEHVCQITCRLTGQAPPRLSCDIEERLRLMFIAVQEPFEQVKGRRKNFLSYSYTLQQFMRLLGVDSKCMSRLAFTLLKGRDKLARQNTIYQRVCDILQWEYRPLLHDD